jgi:hypothetical protein
MRRVTTLKRHNFWENISCNAASTEMQLRFKRDEAAFWSKNAASEAAFAPFTLRPFLDFCILVQADCA